ncbi:MAG: hypothetical protein M3N13_09930 [Candidatus Eremiobacteraeota bacterium]|nr:hypothetical protein [Candidatus Eremiobacteraeota bacterium]
MIVLEDPGASEDPIVRDLIETYEIPAYITVEVDNCEENSTGDRTLTFDLHCACGVTRSYLGYGAIGGFVDNHEGCGS